jgi:hypothetical protein
VGENSFALDGVQSLAHLGGRVLVVVQIADEGGDGALEVDVVFPQRIVGVDEQRLAGREAGHGLRILGFRCQVSGVSKPVKKCRSVEVKK